MGLGNAAAKGCSRQRSPARPLVVDNETFGKSTASVDRCSTLSASSRSSRAQDAICIFKSTLLAELGRRRYAVVEEPGRRIVKDELEGEG